MVAVAGWVEQVRFLSIQLAGRCGFIAGCKRIAPVRAGAILMMLGGFLLEFEVSRQG
jgi:hypothetical protein